MFMTTVVTSHRCLLFPALPTASWQSSGGFRQVNLINQNLRLVVIYQETCKQVKSHMLTTWVVWGQRQSCVFAFGIVWGREGYPWREVTGSWSG